MRQYSDVSVEGCYRCIINVFGNSPFFYSGIIFEGGDFFEKTYYVINITSGYDKLHFELCFHK